MNKTELVSSIADKNNITKKDAEGLVDGLIETIIDALNEGDKVNINGFGVFDVKVSPERRGRNPRTGEEIIIQEHKSVTFKASKSIKLN